MTSELDDDLVLREIEKERIKALRHEERKKKEEEYEKAVETANAKTFDKLMSFLSALFSFMLCVSIVWNSSPWLLLFLGIMVVLSFVFRYLAKKHFFSGDMKKFNVYNKAAGATGVVSSVFELADTKNYLSKGALDKSEALESKAASFVNHISEVHFSDGTYKEEKYDTIRARAAGMGSYIQARMNVDMIDEIVDDVKTKRMSMNLSESAVVKLGVMSMYVKDYMDSKLTNEDSYLFQSCLGSLYYFLHPLSEIPDYVPLVGYRDDMFVTYCVYAGSKDKLDEFKVHKVEEAKNSVKEEFLKDSDTVWEKLKVQGYKYLLDNKATLLIEESLEKVHDIDVGMEEKYKKSLILLTDIVRDFSSKEFTSMSPGTYHGIVGTLVYWVLKEDLLPDTVSVIGYSDDEAVLDCCLSKGEHGIQSYTDWTVSRYLLSENDPLTEYLNTVIGNDERMRSEEIKRMARLCKDASIHNDVDKARYVLKDIL